MINNDIVQDDSIVIKKLLLSLFPFMINIYTPNSIDVSSRKTCLILEQEINYNYKNFSEIEY